jgi:hypothetical protein
MLRWPPVDLVTVNKEKTVSLNNIKKTIQGADDKLGQFLDQDI